MFEAAEAYERDMGRWSKRLAPLFVEFVGIDKGDRVLDVGCGTGSLAWTIVKTTAAGKIVGIDPSAGFLDYARSHYSDSRLTFEVGDAQRLPFPDAAFDRCLSLLIMRHVPDASKATSEMRRVTRPGGVLGTAMWDSSGGHQLNQCLWDAAAALNWQEKLPVESESYGSPEELRALWAGTGLKDISVKELSFPCEFSSFDELWIRRFIEGQGITAAYVKGLSEDHRGVLRERLRHNLLGSPVTLTAKAWAIRGTVPAG
jgi:ubiquinone/menaquinone biosynthesis C-methylase UbiE